MSPTENNAPARFCISCVALRSSLTSGAMRALQPTYGAMLCHILPLTEVNLTPSLIPCLTTRVSAPKHPPPSILWTSVAPFPTNRIAAAGLLANGLT